MLSGLLLLTFFPLIAGIPKNFDRISGGPLPPFLGRWLLVTAVLFAGSAVLLAIRVRLAGARRGRICEDVASTEEDAPR